MVNSPHRIEGQSSSAGDAWLEAARARYCVRAGSFQGATARTEWRAPPALARPARRQRRGGNEIVIGCRPGGGIRVVARVLATQGLQRSMPRD